MGTFQTIKDRVATNIIDLPTSVQSAIGALVNAAQDKLEQLRDWKVSETLGGPYVTAASTRVLVAAPGNWRKANGEPFFLTALGLERPMSLVSDRAAALAYTGGGSTFIGQPSLLLDTEPSDTGAHNFEVYPFSDGASDWSDGQYRIYIPYFRFLPDLVNPSDTNWFTVNCEEYLVKKATAEGFYMDWDEARAAVWEKRALTELGDAVKLDKLARLGATDTLVPLWRGANQPRVRR